MRKAYFGDSGEQVHYRVCESKGTAPNSPLICLPASPHSGLYYTAVMPALSAERDVYSVDYPGFGGSDPLPEAASIETLAESLQPLLETIGPVDVLGFHSGCLVGLELGHQVPDLIERILMIDVPYFDVETRAKYGKKFGEPLHLPKSVNDLEDQFTSQITKRSDDLGHERAFALWAEMMRAGTGVNDIFRAAFNYECEQKFAEMQKPVDLIATQSGLLEPTRAAAKILKNATLREQLSIDRAVFDLHAPQITEEILAVLAT